MMAARKLPKLGFAVLGVLNQYTYSTKRPTDSKRPNASLNESTARRGMNEI